MGAREKQEKQAKANASWPLEDSSYKKHLGPSRAEPPFSIAIIVIIIITLPPSDDDENPQKKGEENPSKTQDMK